jgi:2-polyprenyl-6-methoxyphenol hydroxylase-like FAD-dependent oxidoreductase
MTKSAIVAGGGIAGALAAIALHQAGWSPTIYEAKGAEADERGAFLTVAVNGLNALRTLGLDPSVVLEAGFATPALHLGNGAGRRLAVLPLGGPLPDGTTTTTIRRADLYAALRAAAGERGIPIEYGKRLDAVDDGDGHVKVTFDDGTAAAGDLLVGADGIRSRTRRVLNPDGPEPEYLGLLNAGGFSDRPISADLDRTPGAVHMTFGRRAFFGWTIAPGGSVWWFANPPRKQPVRPGEFTPSSWRDYLIELFEGDAGPAAAIIRATSETLGPWNTEDLRRVPVWHRGRVVLLGDAAHAVSPASGQGASMAMEDAATLGSSLREADPLAFYEQQRRERVEKVVAVGRRNGSGKTAGPVGAAIRDALTPLIMKLVYRKGDPQAWIFEHRI